MTILQVIRAPAALACATVAAGLALAACSPALNWRDVRPEDTELFAMFPCKPSGPTRNVPLAGAQVKMTVLACDADGMTFGITYADVGDPSRVGPAMQALATSAAANVGASAAPAPAPFSVPGATPHAGTGRVDLSGRRPDGTAIQAKVGYFTRGTHVYQATVLGNRIPAEAVETFFGSLKAGG